MKKLVLTCATAALISTGGAVHGRHHRDRRGPCSRRAIEPEYCAKKHTHVTEHAPVQICKKIVIGQPVPRQVELEAVPVE